MGEADREREALAWHLQEAQSAHARAAQDLEAAQSEASVLKDRAQQLEKQKDDLLVRVSQAEQAQGRAQASSERHAEALREARDKATTLEAQKHELEELAASASTLKTTLEKKDAQLARSDKIIEKLRKDVSALE